MKSVQISINTAEKVKSFIKDIAKLECECDLVSGNYSVNAKSMMGIFSLDISNPVHLNIYTEDNTDANTDAVLHALAAYMV